LLAIPILLSRISSLFHLLITSFTTFLHSAVLVKSAPIAKAFPPLFLIKSTVFCANFLFISTTSTFAPASASNIDAALPFPMPSLSRPAPVTIATLSFNPKSIFFHVSPILNYFLILRNFF